ncbi:MAG: O-antigen ligase family protein [Bacteroidetes bacterium]|jgi:O-antigen ligase|nr:O-antigen ligase family protein [Bacteroidota bacterium]MBK8673673.1 O-antigen ligase family protein [Bacteroidota bacterium]MBK9354309.1 O-antigen ligase family protein [Bacteroidota bacterium]MBL0078045.1 O-antigen ligase family protein [Bacteroidota bacterium]
MLKDFVQKYSTLIFFGYGFIVLIALAFGLLFNQWAAFFAPVLLLFVAIGFYDFKWLYFLLILVMPLSIEVSLPGGFSTDLPTEPIVIGLMLVFVFTAFLNPTILKGDFFMHPISILLVIHFGWILSSSIFSTDFVLSLKFLLSKFWYLSVFYFLTGLIIINERILRAIIWIIFIPTIVGIVVIMERHSNFGYLFEYINKAVVPIYRNHVNYGVFITMLVPLMVMGRFWYKKGSIIRLIWDLGIIITLVGIYFTYTRGAWLALLACPIIYFIVKREKMKQVLMVSAISVTLFFGYLISNQNYLRFAPNYERTIYHANLKDHLVSTFSGQDMSTMERFYRWVAAFNMVGEKPLFGFGPNTFVKNYKSYTVNSFVTYISRNEENSTVHNYFILLLAEQGIPGMLIFAFWVFVLLTYAERIFHQQKTNKDKWIVMGALLCACVFLINNLFSDLLEANKLAPLFFIMAAILVNWDIKSKQLLEAN